MLVGYAPGVWDLFHVGHLAFLQKARSQCDRLIVGVASDRVVFEDKVKYPIIPEEDRREIVGALEVVDVAIVYPVFDFIPELLCYLPDILFVGEFWGGARRHERAEAWMSTRGQVIRIPYTQRVSTTQLIEQIRET